MKLIIGENIRRLRLAKDLTQEQLAEELGVSPQTVSRWEGCSSYPDVELLPEIAGYFDISVDALIGADIVRQQAHLKAGIRMIHEEKDGGARELRGTDGRDDIPAHRDHGWVRVLIPSVIPPHQQ